MADISSPSSSLELALSRSHPAEQREGVETLERSPLDLVLDDGALCGLCSAGTDVPLGAGAFPKGFGCSVTGQALFKPHLDLGEFMMLLF